MAKKKPDDELHPRHKQLVDLLLTESVSHADAYFAVGYKAPNETVAASNVRKILCKPNVKAYIRKRQNHAVQIANAESVFNVEVTLAKTVVEVAKIAYADRSEVRDTDKLKALDMLLRMMGAYEADNRRKIDITSNGKSLSPSDLAALSIEELEALAFGQQPRLATAEVEMQKVIESSDEPVQSEEESEPKDDLLVGAGELQELADASNESEMSEDFVEFDESDSVDGVSE